MAGKDEASQAAPLPLTPRPPAADRRGRCRAPRHPGVLTLGSRCSVGWLSIEPRDARAAATPLFSPSTPRSVGTANSTLCAGAPRVARLGAPGQAEATHAPRTRDGRPVSHSGASRPAGARFPELLVFPRQEGNEFDPEMGPVGFEPTTSRLSAGCSSQTKLRAHRARDGHCLLDVLPPGLSPTPGRRAGGHASASPRPASESGLLGRRPEAGRPPSWSARGRDPALGKLGFKRGGWPGPRGDSIRGPPSGGPPTWSRRARCRYPRSTHGTRWGCGTSSCGP